MQLRPLHSPLNRMGPRIFVTVALLTCLTVLGTAAQCLSTLEDVLREYQEDGTKLQGEAQRGRVQTRLAHLLDAIAQSARRSEAAGAAPRVRAAALADALLAAEPLLVSVAFVSLEHGAMVPVGAAERDRQKVGHPEGQAKVEFRPCDALGAEPVAAAAGSATACLGARSVVIRGAPELVIHGRVGRRRNTDIAMRAGHDLANILSAGRGGDVWVLVQAEPDWLATALTATAGGVPSLFDAAGIRVSPPPDAHQLLAMPSPNRKQVKAFLASGRSREVLPLAGVDDAISVAMMSRMPDAGDLVSVITSRPDVAYRRLYRLRFDLLLSGAVFTLVSLLLAFELARRISGPLQRVTEMTQAISRGALDVRVNVRGVEEVVSLGTSVNEMASRIALLMDEQRDAGRMAAELETARLVHELTFPPALVRLRGFTAHAYARSASECCGDLWGHLPLPDGRTAVFIADASGHGVSSAFVTVAARTAFGVAGSMLRRLPAAAAAAYGPAALLSLLNQAVYETGHGRVLMTMLLVVVDADRGALCYANAGHHFPYLLHAPTPPAGAPWGLRSLQRNGDILGTQPVVGSATWTEAIDRYTAGDKLVLFSDGVLDNCNDRGERFGRRRLQATLLRLAAEGGAGLCGGFRATYEEFAAAAAPSVDDCTLVVLDLHAPAAA